ncbi:MAG: glycosyltransferase family 4 protein [Chloroflexi bacterium]|nr:glycosyltransferase family 4 protein [Chloroflexota bacterium]
MISSSRFPEIKDLPVIVASTYWTVNGVNIFSTNLVHGLQERGFDAHILLTMQGSKMFSPPHTDSALPMPENIQVNNLPVNAYASWPMHWAAMSRYLEEHKPCIYIPNHDWWHSCVSPKAPEEVIIVGTLHNNDQHQHNYVSALGKYWNAVVAVSGEIAKQVVAHNPGLEDRVVTIPNGVMIPSNLPLRARKENAPLRIVYAGRLVQHQKRIHDLPKIVSALVERGVPLELTIIGGDPPQLLLDESSEYTKQKKVRFTGALPNSEVIEIFSKSDAFILTSEFEGLPLSLLEAMGQGCVPVVTDIPSGIPEVVIDGENGFLIPVGDIDTFASRLSRLQNDPSFRREMSKKAYQKVHAGKYGIENMVENYINLFHRVANDSSDGVYIRSNGRIAPPKSLGGKRPLKRRVFAIEVLLAELSYSWMSPIIAVILEMLQLIRYKRKWIRSRPTA